MGLCLKAPFKEQGLLRGSFVLFLDRTLRMAIGFGVGIVLARYYGPEQYGQISYLIALTAIFGSVASFGLDELIPRDLASGVKALSLPDILKTGALLRLCSEVTAYALLILTLFTLKFDADTQILGSLLGLYYLFQVTDTIEFSLRVHGHFGAIARARISAALLSGAIKVILAFNHAPLWSIMLAMLVEFGITSFMMLWSSSSVPSWTNGRFDGAYARTLLVRALPLVISGALALLQNRMDTLLVEQYFGHAALGRYSAALRLTELLDMTAIVLSLLLIPDFGKLKDKALDQRIELAYLGGFILFGMSLPVLGLIYLFFSQIYGPAYSEAAGLIPWLAIRPLFYIISVIRVAALLSRGSVGLIPLYPALSVTLIAMTFQDWVQSFNLEGAAMAGSASILTASLIVDLIFNKGNLVRILRSPLSIPNLFKRLFKSSVRTQNFKG